MKLHTVFVTHNRLELTKRAIASYFETVTVPHTVCVFDNASTDGTAEWLEEQGLERVFDVILSPENRYPGYAANRGWEQAPRDATHLQRADNDFLFLPGWCQAVMEMFGGWTGQVGLRTDEEEGHAEWNVGGNNIILRKLFDKGLRYVEAPWTDRTTFPPGWSEDSFFSPAVRSLGYKWKRVQRPCIVSMASGDWKDPYYQRSYGDRGIRPRPDDPTRPGTT